MEKVFVLINRGREQGFDAGRIVEENHGRVTVDYGMEVETTFSDDVIERYETIEEAKAVSSWLNIINWGGGIEYAEREAATSSSGKYLPEAVRIERKLHEAWTACKKELVVGTLPARALPF